MPSQDSQNKVPLPTPGSSGAIDSSMADSGRVDVGAVPTVWLLLSDKTGDNAQLQVVADALPWPCMAKRIEVLPPYVQGKPRVAASIHHIDLGRSDPLESPWPDLVLAIGRRMSMVALWIQQQSQGHTKIALIGPPKRMLDRFDLAVASVQYRLPSQPNL